MKLVAATLLSLLLGAAPADLSATDTGINGATNGTLSATPRSKRMAMCLDGARYNQLSLTITVTPGTTTTVVAKCFESETGDANTWGAIPICDGNAASACAPDSRTYTLSDYDTQNSKKVISSNWKVRKCWALCTLDDPANGTGTAVLTGSRSAQ